MTTNELTLWIQAGATVAAVAAAIIALVVSALDRKNTRTIAASDRAAARNLVREDRVAALRQSQLLFEHGALEAFGEFSTRRKCRPTQAG